MQLYLKAQVWERPWDSYCTMYRKTGMLFFFLKYIWTEAQSLIPVPTAISIPASEKNSRIAANMDILQSQ